MHLMVFVAIHGIRNVIWHNKFENVIPSPATLSTSPHVFYFIDFSRHILKIENHFHIFRYATLA